MKTSELVTAFQASRIIDPSIISTHLGDASQTISAALGDVLPEFSRDVPRVKPQDFTASDAWVELAGWYEDSFLISIEGPTGEHPRAYIPRTQIDVDRLTGKIRLYGVTTGIACEARFTIMHETPNTGECSIPVARKSALFYLLAATLCERIAVKHAETHRANTIDVVDYTSKSREFAALAKNFRTQYRQLVGAPAEPTVAPVEVEVAYDAAPWRIFP